MEKQSMTRMSPEEALERAKALALKLGERIKEGETLRRQPDETVQDIIDSGLIRILQPTRFSGHELTLDSLVDTTIEVAKLNPAAGWIYTFMVIHQWLLAFWPEQAQQEIWPDNPDVNIATSLNPPKNLSLARVDGGYRLSGQWAYSSGIDHSEWVMVATMMDVSLAEGEKPENYFILLPRSDYQIIDNWHVAGLKGSGSNTFQVKDVFVPEHRLISLTKWAGEGWSPGMSVNKAAQYNVPLFCAFPTCLTSAILGATMGAYETFLKSLREKLSKVPQHDLAKLTHLKLRVSEMSAQLEAAEGLLRKNLEMIRPGGEFDAGQRARLHRNYSYLNRICSRVIDEIFQYSGSASIYDEDVLQLYWRDVKVMTKHGYLNFDAALEVFGSYELSSNN